ALASLLPDAPPGRRQSLAVLPRALRARRLASALGLVTAASLFIAILFVLAPLRLDAHGFGALGITIVFASSAACASLLAPLLGRWSDRGGRRAPIATLLAASVAASLIVPFAASRWLLAPAVVFAALAYEGLWVPGTTLITEGVDEVGIDQSLGFALMNLGIGPGF